MISQPVDIFRGFYGPFACIHLPPSSFQHLFCESFGSIYHVVLLHAFHHCSRLGRPLHRARRTIAASGVRGRLHHRLSFHNPEYTGSQSKDADGCVGSGTMTEEPKDGMEGFFIPTGFTPNPDGKNDVFRPMVFGNILKYKFTIYNHWGHMVFDTTDAQKGWNGTVAGRVQGGSMYIWQCTYRLEGQEEKLNRGTVMVMR